MEILQIFFQVGFTTLVIALIASGVYKVFQIATDVREMKDFVKDIRRNLDGTASLMPRAPMYSAPPQRVGTAPSPEELVRAIHAQKFGDDDFPV